MLQFWNSHTGEPVGEPLPGHVGWRVTNVVFSLEGTRMVSSGDDETLQLWNAQTKEPLGAPFRHAYGVASVAFSVDGTRVISSDKRGILEIWNATIGDPIGTTIIGGRDWMASS